MLKICVFLIFTSINKRVSPDSDSFTHDVSDSGGITLIILRNDDGGKLHMLYLMSLVILDNE